MFGDVRYKDRWWELSICYDDCV